VSDQKQTFSIYTADFPHHKVIEYIQTLSSDKNTIA